MKAWMPFVVVAWLVWLAAVVYGEVHGGYEIDRDFWAEWTLADRSSTIEQKSVHMDRFVEALEKADLKGEHAAVWLKTPQNSFDQNLEALKTLQSRLRQIQGMDPKSFEYQTAIQQITAQEQGEAFGMLHAFRGCWWKKKHFLLWDWVETLNILALVGVGLGAGMAITISWESNRARFHH